jgi:hypothetical protein
METFSGNCCGRKPAMEARDRNIAQRKCNVNKKVFFSRPDQENLFQGMQFNSDDELHEGNCGANEKYLSIKYLTDEHILFVVYNITDM